MSFFDSLKRFFGFGARQKTPPPPSTIEQFQAKLAAVPEAERPAFVQKAAADAEVERRTLLALVRGQAGHAESFFVSARNNFALSCYLYGVAHPARVGVDKEYEALLGLLPQFAEVFAKPSPELLDKIDSYIQGYEEALYLAEASGRYLIGKSENGTWIRFPFLVEKHLKPGRKPEAERQLAKLFVACPELTVLEMETRVPWQPVSFVDLLAQNKQSRMSLLFEPGTHSYYAYRYQ